MSGANKLLLLSLIIAVLSISTRWTVLPFIPADFAFAFLSGLLIIPWLIVLTVSLLRHGRRGLWILIGAPLVAYWPTMFVMLWWVCTHRGCDL